MKQTSYNILIFLIRLIHICYLILAVISLPLLIIHEPFWIWIPIYAWMAHHMFAKFWNDCPLTKIENKLRQNSGKELITNGFVNDLYKKIRGTKNG